MGMVKQDPARCYGMGDQAARIVTSQIWRIPFLLLTAGKDKWHAVT